MNKEAKILRIFGISISILTAVFISGYNSGKVDGMEFTADEISKEYNCYLKPSLKENLEFKVLNNTQASGRLKLSDANSGGEE